MKNIARVITIIFIASIFAAACNSDAKNKARINLKAYQDSVKRTQDSLKLDSFRRVEAVKKAEIEQAAALRSRNGSNSTTYIQQQAPAKKGWSSAAKGAVIGAGAGAVTGVLIDKKDGRGAVIGGVVGAGTGYVIGRSKDKKSGRVQK